MPNQKNSNYDKLKDKWLNKHRKAQEALLSKHKEIIHSLIPKQQILGGLLLAAVPFMSITPKALTPHVVNAQEQTHISKDDAIAKLKGKLPTEVRALTPDEEKDISQLLSESYHVKAQPELNGIRLNRSYGFIGQEQHLARYPGDSVAAQMATPEDSAQYAKEGMAPGLGAWGYFAPSATEMTTLDSDREKYYIAVQTFLSPGFNENVGRYGLFYKYRKMLVVNPENGKALVADIGDAGPAQWTGKHLGGSPEVMRYLERVDGAQKGPVLYFFIDDPSDTIPLGPIDL